MSDESTAVEREESGSEQAADPIKNLKAEYERKLGNMEQSVSGLSSKLDALLDGFNKVTTPKQETESLSDLMYSDPDAYARKIEERTAANLRSEWQKAQEAERQQQAMAQQVIGRVQEEFPEVGQPGTELYNRLQTIAKDSPTSVDTLEKWEAVVYREALRMGEAPRSRRSDDGDGFVMSGKRGSNSLKKKKEDKSEISDASLEFALRLNQARGRKITPEQLKKNIEEAASRRGGKWFKYQDQES